MRLNIINFMTNNISMMYFCKKPLTVLTSFSTSEKKFLSVEIVYKSPFHWFHKKKVKKTCLVLGILYLAENHKINLIFGYENCMELFTTITILKYEIGDTMNKSALLLRLIDAHIRMRMCEASDFIVIFCHPNLGPNFSEYTAHNFG